MKRATKETTAGRQYLHLQREARRTGRPTDELVQLYALECFLDRLARSSYTENFVLKGGVLLAALEARRPTRDIDLSARVLDNDVTTMLRIAQEIAAMKLDDGVMFANRHPRSCFRLLSRCTQLSSCHTEHLAGR